MIIAWWDKESPKQIELIDEDALPWINANWIEKRPADEDEIRMYKLGIKHYKIGGVKWQKNIK